MQLSMFRVFGCNTLGKWGRRGPAVSVTSLIMLAFVKKLYTFGGKHRRMGIAFTRELQRVGLGPRKSSVVDT